MLNLADFFQFNQLRKTGRELQNSGQMAVKATSNRGRQLTKFESGQADSYGTSKESSLLRRNTYNKNSCIYVLSKPGVYIYIYIVFLDHNNLSLILLGYEWQTNKKPKSMK